MALRILASIILIISILFLPIYISILLALVFMFYFKLFYEAPILFIFSDLIYGVAKNRFLGMVFVSSIAFFILLFFIELLKKKLKFYPNNNLK